MPDIPGLPLLAEWLTPEQWSALGWIVLTALMTTYTVNVLWRYLPHTTEAPPPVLLLISLGAAIVAALHVWPADDVHPFMVAAIAGPGTYLSFWGVSSPLKRWVPWLWQMIHMERRNPNRIRRPPGGLDRRAG